MFFRTCKLNLRIGAAIAGLASALAVAAVSTTAGAARLAGSQPAGAAGNVLERRSADRSGTAASVNLTAAVALSSDDAEQRTSTQMYLTSSDIEMTWDGQTQIDGLRFNGLQIPKGATVTTASVQFQADESQSEPTNLTIYGEAADNAGTFTSTSDDIGSRPKTAARVAWSNIPAWTAGERGPSQKTPDLGAIVQEIVNRSGWAAGNSLALIITGTGHRTADAFDEADATHTPATLTVTYQSASGVPSPPARGSWTLKFDDEFNGTSVDLTKWRPNWMGGNNTAITPPANRAELSCYDPAMVSEGNGVLTLSAAQSSCTAYNGNSWAYRSGLIESYNHYQFTYGYFEAKQWLPTNSSGIPVNWPAFWAVGTGPWPSTGEIDVLEVLGGGRPDCWHFHYSGGGPGGCPALWAGASQYGGWHTFGADWEPGRIDFYYDSVKVGCLNNSGTNGCGFATITSSPMYLIANLAISTQYGGPVSVPSKTKFDYIRVWQH